jgi:hypothetical protein
MLKIHSEPQVVRALCATLNEVAKLTTFYPQLVGEIQVDIMLATLLKPATDDTLFEVLLKIMQLTKVPVRFLIAAKILKLSENTVYIESLKIEKVVVLMRILHYISSNLDNQERNDFGRKEDQLMQFRQKD